MTLWVQQFGMTALIALFLISCNADGDVAYRESSNQKYIVPEDTVFSKNFDKDMEFARHVAENSMLEMQLATLAINRSASDTIKGFAVSLMTDQSIVNSDVRLFAERRGVTLENSLSSENQKKYDALAAKSAGEFDKAYCSFLVREREEIVTRFKEEANTGTDPELKEWAARKLVTLEQHLATARGLNESRNE